MCLVTALRGTGPDYGVYGLESFGNLSNIAGMMAVIYAVVAETGKEPFAIFVYNLHYLYLLSSLTARHGPNESTSPLR